MKIKKIEICLKLLALSSLILTSCSQNEIITDYDLETTNADKWSENSDELSVVAIYADEEQTTNPIENAIDNDSDSRWSGFGNPVNLILDLGSVNLVDFINIAFLKGDERTNNFFVYFSTDNSNWNYTNNKTSSGETEGLQLFDLKNTEARYIKLELHGNSNNDWNSIFDIEVFGTKGDDSGEPTSSNYTSIPGTIQAENFDSQLGTKIEETEDIGGGYNVGYIDSGEYLTYNLNVPSSGTYTVDFRVASIDNATEFDFYQGSTKLTTINKEETGDWQNWITTSKIVNLTAGDHEFKILATSSRWNINWIRFTEGEEVISTPPTTTTGSVEDILGDFWKITMPYDEDGKDSGNVSDPDDRNNDAVEYYDLDEASSDYPNNLYVQDGEVFFVAHCGGATTSGSIYPRCELRQLDSNGDDELVSFDKKQTFEVTVRAVQTPIEKPEVCMVQLKGSSSNEIIRVDFTKDSQGLHLTQNEDSTEDDVIDYDLGDRLYVKITLEEDQVRLELINLDNGDSFDETWDHDDDEGYFKVGSYVQSSVTYCEEKSLSNCTDDDEDAVGIVAVSNLTYTIDD